MKIKEGQEARRLRIEEGLSIREIRKRLNISRDLVRKWIKGVELTDKQKEKLKKNYRDSQYKNEIPNEKLFSNPCYMDRKGLKKRIKKYGLLPNRCDICGCDPIWRGKKLVFILDHINGNNMDCRLDNLRFLCPNCNSQQPTFCKNKKEISQRNAIDKRKLESLSGVIQKSRSMRSSLIAMGIPTNQGNFDLIKKMCHKLNISTSHFIH